MLTGYQLRKLASNLEELKNAKENYVISLEKQANKKLNEQKNQECIELEKDALTEEVISKKLDETCKFVETLKKKCDLQELIAEKKLKEAFYDADQKIAQLYSEEIPYFKASEEEPVKGDCVQEEITKGLEMQKLHKEIEAKKELEEKIVSECVAEEQSLREALKKELVEQKRKLMLLKRRHVQMGLMESLEERINAEEELNNLRIEDCYWRNVEESRLREEEEENIKLLKEKTLREERELQKRTKTEMDGLQKKRDETYLTMLVELQREEDSLEVLRGEARRRREMQRRVAAQQVLEERKRRRRCLMEQQQQEKAREYELTVTREMLMKEEEKSLLLTYLPHLRPFLTSEILDKLSSL